jgi:hypothetical protein
MPKPRSMPAGIASGLREPRVSPLDANQVLMKLELLPVTNYLPDVLLLRRNDVRIIMAVGKWAQDRKTWLSEVSHIPAERLGCELVTFPGHHGSYTDMPTRPVGTDPEANT